MIIGIPKEIMHDENRVACTPETVGKFVNDGFKVLVEKTAGEGALYHDEDYIKAGATMVEDPVEIYNTAEIILKVKEPLFNEKLGKHEVELMHKGQYLITFIHPASPVNHEMVKKCHRYHPRWYSTYLSCTEYGRTDINEYLRRI